MPTLVINLLGKRKRVKVGERACVGRADVNDVAIDHPAISRTHLLIQSVDHAFIVEDVGSANGTLLNGKLVRGKQPLADGARLTIGPATITFHSDDAVLETAQPDQSAAEAREGILLQCSCGARLWVPEERIGSAGRCRQCGAEVALAQSQVCSICHWEMLADAQKKTCPECGLTFHAECWQANRGCSAYGCSQVNVLRVSDELAEPGTPDTQESAVFHDEADRVTWEDSLLVAALAASLISLIAFGVPSLLVAATAIAFMLQSRKSDTGRSPRVTLCIAISIVGLLAGIAASGYWWLGWTFLR